MAVRYVQYRYRTTIHTVPRIKIIRADIRSKECTCTVFFSTYARTHCSKYIIKKKFFHMIEHVAVIPVQLY